MAALLCGTFICVSEAANVAQLHSLYKGLMLTVKCSVCIYAWFVLFTAVLRIEISDGYISARTLIKKISIKESEIREVRSDPLFLRVAYDGGHLRIPYQMDGVANVKDLFTVSNTATITPTSLPIKKQKTDLQWPPPGLVIRVIIILSFPLLFFWIFFSQMEGGLLYKLADLLRRSKVEMLLQTEFGPLVYITLVFIALVSISDILILSYLKCFRIDATITYFRSYSDGAFWKDLGMRIGIVWGIVLLDRMMKPSIWSALPLAATLDVNFLYSTIMSAIRFKRKGV